MEGMEGMEGLGSMGSAMALEEVDLFGDPVMDDALAGLPPRPLVSKSLLQRLDDLRVRGCCQGIAWSRQGTIATIAKDAMSVELRFIRSHPDTTEWGLSEPSSWSPPSPTVSPPVPNPPASISLASSSAPFVHLAWSPTMSPDLAVIDALGRLTILSFSIANNQPYPARRWETDAADDLHAVVGCYWLPQGMASNKQFHLIHGPATKSQSEYRYEHQFFPASGPWHPNPSKSAFLCVTTNGFLKLFFTQNNGRPEETALELESVTSSDDLITHASLCSDKNTLLVALATSSKQLRIVRVGIQWGLPQVDKQVLSQSQPLRPSLRESHVAVTSWVQYGSSESAVDASVSRLSHIEILPSAHTAQSQPMHPPVVLTVRSYVPQDASSYQQESQSIIDRWEVLSDQPQALVPAFEQLGSRNGNTSALPTLTHLRKLEPIILPKVVVAVTTTQFGRVLCFAFSDGTVQYRNRFTMDEIYNELNTDSIMHPLQVGFHFVNDTPCLQVAFSPTNCSFVQIGEDSTIKWNRLHHPMENSETEFKNVDQKTVRVALTVALSATAASQAACDDVLAIARPFAQFPDFASSWVKETVNMLKIAVDYSENTHHEQLVKNVPLQHCLSVINHLGFHGDFRPRSHGGKFAMLALSVKGAFLVITVASNSPIGTKEKLIPLDDPDVVDAVTGCTAWGISLLAWLSDSLFELLDDPEITAMLSGPKRFPELAKYLESKNNVALQLLLCSSTRGFLLALCRRLQHIESVSNRAAQYYETRFQQQDPAGGAAAPARPHPALSRAYQRMERVISSALVKVSEFERLLSDLGSDIQAAYHKSFSGLVATKIKPQPANMTEQQLQQHNEQFIKKAQTHCELDMLLGQNPPPSFREVLLKLFSTTLPAFRAQTDPAKLYFADYSLLELNDNPTALAARKASRRYVDVFKRTELLAGTWKTSAAGRRSEAETKPGGGGVPPPVAGNSSSGGSGMLPAGDNGMASYRMTIFGTWTGIGGDSDGPQWRRCVRCAAIVGDLFSGKPGYHFVLSQQRKCVCGGSWGTVPRGT
ncbi:mediator complex, subunit Med16 [Chaetomium tenue]|uniref:Mediator complex, subunit Med16 n=1 Tax=Chaetomium tenue TaxID=1854479 RepID=A0ACB7PRI1_9PEZI|nr:mediator complex, subunit Med16 [Chaetomium globosum]